MNFVIVNIIIFSFPFGCIRVFAVLDGRGGEPGFIR